jgi:hypothetical protein
MECAEIADLPGLRGATTIDPPEPLRKNNASMGFVGSAAS